MIVVDEVQDEQGVRGGFGGALRSRMSPRLRQQLAELDAVERREQRRVERERAEAAEVDEARRRRLSLELAAARGEVITAAAVARGGIGHTPGEFVALVAAGQDAEDLAAERRRAAALEERVARFVGQHQALIDARAAAGQPIGRTPAEAVAAAWAQQDLADALAGRSTGAVVIGLDGQVRPDGQAVAAWDADPTPAQRSADQAWEARHSAVVARHRAEQRVDDRLANRDTAHLVARVGSWVEERMRRRERARQEAALAQELDEREQQQAGGL